MLATWLVEIYLAKINELEDAAAAERASEDADNIHAERSMVEEDMRHFLTTYKVSLGCAESNAADFDSSRELRRTIWNRKLSSISSDDMVETRSLSSTLLSSALMSELFSIMLRKKNGPKRYKLSRNRFVLLPRVSIGACADFDGLRRTTLTSTTDMLQFSFETLPKKLSKPSFVEVISTFAA